METQMLEKHTLLYPGQDSRTVLAYEQEMSDIEWAIICGVNAAKDFANDFVDTAQEIGEMAWYVQSGQAIRDAADWLFDDASPSANPTPQGGYELRVDTGVGHVELSITPAATADGDSIRINQSISIGGLQIGVSGAIEIP